MKIAPDQEIKNYTPPAYRINGSNKLIISVSSAMLDLFQKINRLTEITASDLDLNILINGESGTGKELIAQALHFNSNPLGNENSYVPVNCTSMPEALLESELFGHIKGAFTGAVTSKKGLVEKANGGTLFLDEIGDMPKEIQAKILRMIQEREFRAVGSVETKKTNLRLVTATHKDLEKLINQGSFRDDLYYRISEFPLYVPPLRERVEDIAPLAYYLIHIYNERYNARFEEFNSSALDKLHSYHWPGNIRELGSVLKRILLIKKEGIIDADDILLKNDKISVKTAASYLHQRASVELPTDTICTPTTPVQQSDQQDDETDNSKPKSKLWYEDGVLPIPITRLLQTGARSLMLSIARENGEIYFTKAYGDERSIILLLTPDNLLPLFDDHRLIEYTNLLDKIKTKPFNAIVKKPFAFYSPNGIAGKRFIQPNDYQDVCGIVSYNKNEFYVVLRNQRMLTFTMSEEQIILFTHPKCNNAEKEEVTKYFQKQIAQEYERFTSREFDN